MNFNKLILTIAIPMLMTAGKASADSVSDLSTNDYSGKADSLNYCFVENFIVKTKGVFKTHPGDAGPGWDIYWQQAHAMDVLIYAYERIKDSDPTLAAQYKKYAQYWYTNKANNWGSSTSFENPFTDDMCWIGLTMMHMAKVFDNRTFYNSAKTIYNNYIAKRKQTDNRGTWLPWNNYGNPDSGPNACTNSPACLLALKLYEHFGDEFYLEDAELYYEFMVNNICKSDGRVEEPPLTYTQGTFGEACRVLYHITGESKYKTKATQYFNYAISSTSRCVDKGILRHEGTSMDQSLFKAVFIPYAVNYALDEDMNTTARKNMVRFLNRNADTLWENLDQEAYPKMYCPYYWGDKFNTAEEPLMGAMASGASLMENVARMNLALQAISGISETIVTSAADNAEYNLQGMKVGNNYHGIVIKNGKKYIKR